MKLSLKKIYAVKALSHLASQPSGVSQSLRVIAKENNIPEAFLGQIFLSLRQKGIVRSIRGKEGGYLLAKSIEQCTLFDVFQAVDAREPFADLDHHQDDLELILMNVFYELEKNEKDFLSKVTLRDITDKTKKSVHFAI